MARRPTAPARQHRASSGLAGACLIAGGLVAYSNSFHGALVFDDEPAIVDNLHIRTLWPLSEAVSAPRDTTLSGRPVATLTFAINYALADPAAPVGTAAPGADGFDRSVWGYHAVNLAIHVLAALALFGIARRTLTSEPLRASFAHSANGLALAIAALWLVHPLQTGSVTYLVQRVESLMGLFYLVTLYCAIRAWDVTPAQAGSHASHSRHRPPGRLNGWWSVASVAACAFGMGTKEVMVTAPLMVMLWDAIFTATPDGERRFAAVWSRRWPLYAGLAATWVILASLTAAGPRSFSVGFRFPTWPWWTYLLTQAGVVTQYLRLAVVPSPLVLDYGWPPVQSVADAAPALLVVLSLLALTAIALIRRPAAGFLGAWFFLILAPTSSVLPIVTEVAAEHRMYLPLAAVIAAVVVGGYPAWMRWQPRGPIAIPAAVAVLAVAAMAVTTRTRNLDYVSDERIWSDTVEKRPSNARARNNYASVLLEQGRSEEAVTQLRAAIRLDPLHAEAHMNLGSALCAQGSLSEGIPHLEQALALAPDYEDAHRNLGEAYASQGRHALAVQHYLSALAQRPDQVDLLNRAGWLLATSPEDDVRDGARAADLAERATRLTNRRDVISLDTLAAARAEAGRFEEAASVGAEALSLAQATGNAAIVPELMERLERYRTRRPVRP